VRLREGGRASERATCPRVNISGIFFFECRIAQIGAMQESGRVIRCYSEDTERPYYQIRYRLSLTGKELLANALGDGSGEDGPGRAVRSSSVSTTVSSSDNVDVEMGGIESRLLRSRSVESPSGKANDAKLLSFSNATPGTPRSRHQKGQKIFIPTIDEHSTEMDLDHPAIDPQGLRRSKSAGTELELHLHRGAPAIPIESLYSSDENLKSLKDTYPQFVAEFRGLVTCLNSKNVRKYRVGQSYRKGIVIGIDTVQGKIIVFQKDMPIGSLVVMRSANASRYEKGFTVQDVQGRTIGTVHAIDQQQNLLVVNTANATPVYHID